MPRIELTELERQKLAKAGADSVSCQHGWRLIDTAPDDGTPILVYGNGEICTIRNYGEWHVVLATPVEDKMQITLEFEFTHWMPLPEGPK